MNPNRVNVSRFQAAEVVQRISTVVFLILLAGAVLYVSMKLLDALALRMAR